METLHVAGLRRQAGKVGVESIACTKNAAAMVPIDRVQAVLHMVANLVLEILEDRQQRMIFFQRLEEIIGRSRGIPMPEVEV